MTDGGRKRKIDKKVDESTHDLQIFEWTITNFTEALKSTEEGEKMISPVFTGKSTGQPNSFWRICVLPNVESRERDERFLVAILQLVEDLNTHNPSVKAKPQIHFLDKNQQVVSGVVDRTDKFIPFVIVSHSDFFDVKNKYMEDDALRVRIKLWIQRDDEMSEPASKIPRKQVLEDLRQLLDSSKFSDVTILVDGETLKAHKNILSCRSPVFEAMLQNEMLESLTSTIKIDDFSYKTVKGMLEFIYYENMDIVDEDFVELLKISEKYQLQDLKLASTKAAILKISLENAIELLVLGDLFNAPELKSRAMQFINSNKGNPMFSSENENEVFEKLAKEHPMLLLEMYRNIRNKVETTAFTTKG